MASLRDDLAATRLLVEDEPSAEDDQPAFAGWLQRMCRAASRHLPAGGVGVNLVDDGGVRISTAASSSTTYVVEEAQFTFGEGPCLAVFRSRRPVLVPDLAMAAENDWPAFARAALDQGLRSVSAVPLQVGTVLLGVLDVYGVERGPLSRPALGRALSFAEVTMEGLLDVGSQPGEVDSFLEAVAASGYHVYQAQGMVMIQLGVSAHEALLRLRAHAYSHDRRLSEVAEDVVERRLVFEPRRGMPEEEST